MTDSVQTLIGAVYEAALSTDGMGAAAQHVAREFEAVAAWHYVMRPGSAEVYVNSGAHGFDETTVAQYQAGIWKEDYAVPAAQIPGITFETHELLSAKARDANEFSRWLKRQAGSHRLIGRSVAASDGLVAGLALHFPNGLARRPEERLKFDLIAPHFGRAFQLAGRFSEAMDQRATLALGVERLRQAVLLLDRAGRVVWANAAGRDLLRRDDGISLSGQRLRFRGPDEAGAFERARRVVRLGVGLTTPAGSLTLPVARPSGRPNYVIEVFETPPAVVAAFGSTSKLLVMIHDPDATSQPSTALSSTWEATPTLAKIDFNWLRRVWARTPRRRAISAGEEVGGDLTLRRGQAIGPPDQIGGLGRRARRGGQHDHGGRALAGVEPGAGQTDDLGDDGVLRSVQHHRRGGRRDARQYRAHDAVERGGVSRVSGREASGARAAQRRAGRQHRFPRRAEGHDTTGPVQHNGRASEPVEGRGGEAGGLALQRPDGAHRPVPAARQHSHPLKIGGVHGALGGRAQHGQHGVGVAVARRQPDDAAMIQRQRLVELLIEGVAAAQVGIDEVRIRVQPHGRRGDGAGARIDLGRIAHPPLELGAGLRREAGLPVPVDLHAVGDAQQLRHPAAAVPGAERQRRLHPALGEGRGVDGLDDGLEVGQPGWSPAARERHLANPAPRRKARHGPSGSCGAKGCRLGGGTRRCSRRGQAWVCGVRSRRGMSGCRARPWAEPRSGGA